LSLNGTVRTKRWLVEGSAPKNASLKVHNLGCGLRNEKAGERDASSISRDVSFENKMTKFLLVASLFTLHGGEGEG
ncbi:hypothetical protein, partial [Staphylococcus pseudintermedius]|uniref:hypothetical protein n=1 Tax=Staphylococcus pseudintermedius TaxID=283734 RepID=UPI001F4417D9